MTDQWFYGDNGVHQGPMSRQQIQALADQGVIGPATMVWCEGMTQWMPYSQVQQAGVQGDHSYASSPAYPVMLAPPTSGLAIASLICGICSLVTCLLPVGIPAVICGHMALSHISRTHPPAGGRGMAIAGLICGYVALMITLFFIATIVISAITTKP